MPTLGIDVGTRGIRISLLENNEFILEMEVKKDETSEALRLYSGIGIDTVCIAGGYQWKELNNEETLSNEVVAFGSNGETHGLRRLIRESIALFKKVKLLPSGGASGALLNSFLINSLDTGTPDKVAKANYVYWLHGLNTFTLIDKGMFVSILYIDDGKIVNFISATRGMPSPMSPGLVDLELLTVYDWPKSKHDIWKAGVSSEVTEAWIDFFEPTFIGKKVVCPGTLCNKFSASRGAALWCNGYKLKLMFSDNYERHMTFMGRKARV